MSEKFSATLRISDLNDFIAPSQDCIVSLKGQKPAAERAEVLINKKQSFVADEPVKISLKDCLACSGCITSAETVMLEKQSLDEFLSHLETKKAVIISLSPQSRAALAVQYGLSSRKVFKKLTTFFKSLGVKAVYDTSYTRDISLIESCTEFVARYRHSKPVKKQWSNLPMLVSACPEVGSVLTTGEVLDLIKAKFVDFSTLEESPLDRQFTNVNDEGQLFGTNGSSGGYAETIFRYAAKEIFGRDIIGPLEFKTIKHSDFREVTLEVNEETVLKFALCYGFRNLQNVVRKIKIGLSDYHYLDVMACPSGCLNGGGQIKPKHGQSGKELLQSLEAVYTDNVLVADPYHNPIIRGLYGEWLEQPGSEKAIKYMHTEYHPIQKSVTAQIHNW